jgi:hypothetical protein
LKNAFSTDVENFYEPNGLCSSDELTTERGIPNFETEKELNTSEKWGVTEIASAVSTIDCPSCQACLSNPFAHAEPEPTQKWRWRRWWSKPNNQLYNRKPGKKCICLSLLRFKPHSIEIRVDKSTQAVKLVCETLSFTGRTGQNRITNNTTEKL